MEKVQRSVCVNATQSAHTHSQPSIYTRSVLKVAYSSILYVQLLV